MVIPAYVFHAHHNVGQTEALFISMPTRIYNHESPDVYRLPLDNNTIPYRFEQRMGWLSAIGTYTGTESRCMTHGSVGNRNNPDLQLEYSFALLHWERATTDAH